MDSPSPLEARLAAALEARADQVQPEHLARAGPPAAPDHPRWLSHWRGSVAALAGAAAVAAAIAAVAVPAGFLADRDGPAPTPAAIPNEPTSPAAPTLPSTPAGPGFFPEVTATLPVGEQLSVPSAEGDVVASLESVPNDLVLRARVGDGPIQEEVVAYWTDDTVLMAGPVRTLSGPPAFAVRANEPDGAEVWSVFGFRDGRLVLLASEDLALRSGPLNPVGFRETWLSEAGVIYERIVARGDAPSGEARVTRAEPDGREFLGGTDLGTWCFAEDAAQPGDVERC